MDWYFFQKAFHQSTSSNMYAWLQIFLEPSLFSGHIFLLFWAQHRNSPSILNGAYCFQIQRLVNLYKNRLQASLDRTDLREYDDFNFLFNNAWSTFQFSVSDFAHLPFQVVVSNLEGFFAVLCRNSCLSDFLGGCLSKKSRINAFSQLKQVPAFKVFPTYWNVPLVAFCLPFLSLWVIFNSLSVIALWDVGRK